ncbi:MAG: 2,3-bisphosphoglycerate-dependent phosphoglycerate mutase, partial [Hydrogenovibrio crunogenus]|nr:2,3-bisphosphoglycerate-dependent phosphoglycerate mutase [Hydrogenovibrio crunogenus]
MPILVLLRHGQSVWNRDDRFTGWKDVDLSDDGVAEAEEAGQRLKAGGYDFDLCFTSVLKRAIRTQDIALSVLDQLWLSVRKRWRLNERHYGALQGLNKTEMREQVGEEQVHEWRRSYATRPPPLEASDPRFPGRDRRYAGIDEAELPRTESLSDTVRRTIPCWHNEIAPALRSDNRI